MPAVTADVAIASKGTPRSILLIRRERDPFAGAWALPGGFIEMDETLEASARRELQEETGLSTRYLEQIGIFGDPGRGPRGRTISIAYLAEVDPAKIEPAATDDAAEVGWFSLQRPPKLAFDHAKILAAVRKRLAQ
ncbi:MAG: NUDIX hydrolase [Gemmataceae bacterium]|nr:NUDIX hydrolase [Gemmataceae bacterium]